MQPEDSTQLSDALYAEALVLYHAGDFQESARKYREILELDGERAEVWRGLGMVYYQQGEYEDALEMLYRSLEVDSSSFILHYSLGLVLARLGYLSEAIEAYRAAIQINPDWIEGYNGLGNVLAEAGDLMGAEVTFRQAIAVQPNYSSYLNLGNILLARQQVNEAIASYQTALELKPRHPDIIANLGLAFQAKNEEAIACLYFGYAAYRRQDYKEALLYFNKFIATQPEDIEVYLALAYCYKYLNEIDAAIAVYKEAISRYPNLPEIYISFVQALLECDRVSDALEVARDASARFPDHLWVKIENQRILPILYDTKEEIDFFRERLTRQLQELIQTTSLETPERRKNALRAIGSGTNFYLPYQVKNDVDLQRQYGQFVHRVMAANYPQWAEPLAVPPLSREGKIKIGYVSACLQWHTVGMVFLGWLRNCDRASFEVHCYSIGGEEDSLTELYRLSCDRFHHIPENLEAACEKITSDCLHVLVFLDIGMYAPMMQLAGLRLAPVQCAAWGHPITTGLPTVDYYFSGDLMEPASGQLHYSEQLIRLPGIGICYAQPAIPELTKTRADFGLRDEAVVYLSCQSLFKYLPQYDYIFAAIAREVPLAEFVFVAHPSPQITEKFRRRLARAFAEVGLNSEQYCRILPRQGKREYWNLLLSADIFLDTFGFSGFLTTLEAVACQLPVVTRAGEFMRSRQSAGILQALGVTETIAEDEAEYIRIAVKLGADGEWRAAVRSQIKQRHPFLYNNRTCVEALEAFYRRTVAKQ